MKTLSPRECWAKTLPDGCPGVSVRDHALNVGCVAEALISRLPPSVRELLPAGAATLAALHDVGKISPGFQQQCAAWSGRNKDWFKPDAGSEQRHGVVTGVVLYEYSRSRWHNLASAVGAHHGFIPGPTPVGNIGTGPWEEARFSLIEEMEGLFGKLPESDLKSEASRWLLAGLIAVSDWVGSDETRFSPEDRGSLDKAAQSRIAAQAIEDLALGGAETTPGLNFEEVFAQALGGNPPRPLQQRVVGLSVVEPAVYVIEDVMGSGKTEAALWLAYRLMTDGHARGIAFTLPTRVTSDRIHRRMLGFLEKVATDHAAALVHGHAWLRGLPRIHRAAREKNDDDGEESAADAVRRWFASTRRGLLAPFAVGTVDQALLAVVAAKWFFVRQFALAGKVVVLDEVHSYDVYTSTLIRELVRRLLELRATPIILSATLTARQKAELLGSRSASQSCHQAPYPAITVKKWDSTETLTLTPPSPPTNRKRVRVERIHVPSFDEPSAAVARAVELAKSGKNVVWVRNTVRHAQETYRRLAAERREGEFELGLLHSRFPAFQRASRPDLNDLAELKRLNLHEERWLWMLGKPEPPRQDARPKASILVATQVVEQSVDIDADVLITDLAPTDMLLQRIGRLHRHERGERGEPTVHVVVPETFANGAETLSAAEIRRMLGAVGRVYDPYVLLRTWAEWKSRSGLTLPDDIRGILEATYAEREAEAPGWAELRDALEQRKSSLEGRALNAANVRGNPLGPDTEGEVTRLGKPQVLLLLLRWCSPQRDRSGNYREIQLLNTKRLKLADYEHFNLDAARQLHLNTAPVPAWWVPRECRQPPPPAIGQYFGDEVVLAVWDCKTGQVIVDLKTDVGRDSVPRIRYSPEVGLECEPPLSGEGRRPEAEAGEEYEDGIL